MKGARGLDRAMVALLKSVTAENFEGKFSTELFMN